MRTPAPSLRISHTAEVAPDPYAGLAAGMLAVAVADLRGDPECRRKSQTWLRDETPGGGGWFAALLGASDPLADVLDRVAPINERIDRC